MKAKDGDEGISEARQEEVYREWYDTANEMIQAAFDTLPELPSNIDQAGLTAAMALNAAYNLVELTDGSEKAKELHALASEQVPQIVENMDEQFDDLDLAEDLPDDAMAYIYVYIAMYLLIRIKCGSEKVFTALAAQAEPVDEGV